MRTRLYGWSVAAPTIAITVIEVEHDEPFQKCIAIPGQVEVPVSISRYDANWFTRFSDAKNAFLEEMKYQKKRIVDKITTIHSLRKSDCIQDKE